MNTAALHKPSSSRTGLRTGLGLICLFFIVSLAACGFRLKGTQNLPFKTLYTNISQNTEFGANLLRALRASSPNTQFVSSPENADALLTVISDRQRLREISLDAAGHVEDYELSLEFEFQLSTYSGDLILPPTLLRAFREMPYDPDQPQAKQSEMDSIFRNMQNSLISRIIHRLSSPEAIQTYQNIQSQSSLP